MFSFKLFCFQLFIIFKGLQTQGHVGTACLWTNSEVYRGTSCILKPTAEGAWSTPTRSKIWIFVGVFGAIYSNRTLTCLKDSNFESIIYQRFRPSASALKDKSGTIFNFQPGTTPFNYLADWFNCWIKLASTPRRTKEI